MESKKHPLAQPPLRIGTFRTFPLDPLSLEFRKLPAKKLSFESVKSRVDCWRN